MKGGSSSGKWKAAGDPVKACLELAAGQLRLAAFLEAGKKEAVAEVEFEFAAGE